MTGVLDDIYGYIRDRALNDPAWLDENGTVWMKKMVLRIEDKVTPEQRKQVLENVVGLVVEDRDRFLGLDVGDMGRLQEMTEPYGVSKAAWDGWVLDWFTNSDTWRASSSNQLNMLYKWLDGLDESAEADTAMSELARFASRKLADSPELDGSQWYFKSLSVLFKTEKQRTDHC